jgi:hypothetical protein
VKSDNSKQKANEYRQTVGKQQQQQQQQQKTMGGLNEQEFNVLIEALMLYALGKDSDPKGALAPAYKEISTSLGNFIKVYNNKDFVNSLYTEVKKAVDQVKQDQSKYTQELQLVLNKSQRTISNLNRLAQSKQPEFKEDQELSEEFDLIEGIIENLAKHNGVDAEAIWEDLESLTDDELYVFAATQPVMEDWQKANKKDRTAGMSQKAVNAYRRENPGSKLKTAVTTKPSKLKKGSKASKRRKSYCSRSRGQMKMHNISCAKTPDKAICAARRRWNCE